MSYQSRINRPKDKKDIKDPGTVYRYIVVLSDEHVDIPQFLGSFPTVTEACKRVQEFFSSVRTVSKWKLDSAVKDSPKSAMAGRWVMVPVGEDKPKVSITIEKYESNTVQL